MWIAQAGRDVEGDAVGALIARAEGLLGAEPRQALQAAVLAEAAARGRGSRSDVAAALLVVGRALLLCGEIERAEASLDEAYARVSVIEAPALRRRIVEHYTDAIEERVRRHGAP